MSILDHFSLPYQGLKDGLHRYHFDADDAYFAAFEASPVKIGKVGIEVELDKKASMSVINFEIKGYVNTACDRCLADINLPISGNYQWHVKQGVKDTSTDDVIYLGADESQLRLAEVIYELIILSMPIIYRYNCELDKPRPCNMDVLNRLNEISETKEEDTEKGSSIWDRLKNIDLN